MIPNPGRIKIYTSGCPKNQNRCWYRIGSPPPLGSKKDVLKFRSVSSIVIAPARTGNESTKRIEVKTTDQINIGIVYQTCDLVTILEAVTKKLIDPRIDEIPARCKEKIDKSTAVPICAKFPDRGGYTVHPVPAPFAENMDISMNDIEGINSHSLMLFSRGKAMSGAFTIIGISQFPNPPIIVGITMKKIMMKA